MIEDTSRTPPEAELVDPDRFVGSSEYEEATIRIWPNAGDAISIWLEEDYRKEGKPDVYCVEALCSLPKPVAAALGRRLCSLAGDVAPDAELAALRAFRDAIDAASVAYHSGAEWADRAVTRFDRAVRIALKDCQDALDARTGAPAPPDPDPLAAARGRARAMPGMSEALLTEIGTALFDQAPLGEPAETYRDTARALLGEVHRRHAAYAGRGGTQGEEG